MRLAIVIEVSKYDNFSNLNQCKNDSNIINEIISLSELYDDILLIQKDTVSGHIFNELDKFVDKYKNKEIEEVLLYFSGHGLMKNDEFYFCTSNTDESKINRSSLSNAIIDSRVRSLNPERFVKIVDACESGKHYIKGTSNPFAEPENNSFNNFYFFASSSFEQKSYTYDDKSSEFTYRMIKVIYEKIKIDNKIKYRDIFNGISDAFYDNELQKPYFNIQGDLSEIFIESNDELLKCLDEFLSSNKNKNNTSNAVNENYTVNSMSEEKALEIKNLLIKKLNNKLMKNSSLLKKYSYKIECDFSNNDSIISREKICNWIINNKEKLIVFAEPVERKIIKPGKELTFFRRNEDYDYITDNFKSNVDDGACELSFNYISSNLGFPKFKCNLIFLFSLTKIHICYIFGKSIPKSWNEYGKYYSSSDIVVKTLDLFNDKDHDNLIKDISDDFKSFCDNYISDVIDILFK